MPPGSPKTGAAVWWLDLWRAGKMPFSEETWSKPYGKTLFWQSCVFLAQWKGGLLRGKVSQGSTSPRKPCVKGLKVRALKRLYDFSHAVFPNDFSHEVLRQKASKLGVEQGLSTDLTRLAGRAEPCRGAFTGCRLCRRPLQNSMIRRFDAG